MERTREARRHNTVAGSGAPARRRHRTVTLRDSPEDGWIETVRSRDRDSFDGNRRRREERLVGVSNRGGGGEESGGGAGEDEETEIRESHSYHDHRKSSGGVARSSLPDSMAVDEIVGVTVPRKARSSSVKRSHEHWVTGNGSASPETSNLSVGKKTKITKSCSETQENIEIEIAEILYGLMKQSHSSEEFFSPNSSQKLESNCSNAETIVGYEQSMKREASLQNLINEKCEVSVQVTALSMEVQKEVAKKENSIWTTTESGGRDGIESAETIVMAKEESPLYLKLDNNLHDSTITKGTSTVLRDENREEKVNSNVKNPDVASSLERNDTIDIRLEPNLGDQDRVLSEVVSVSVEVEETTTKPIQGNHNMLTIDLEQEGANLCRSKAGQDQEQLRLAEPTVIEKKKTVPSSSAALTNNVPCWANRLLPQGSESIVMFIDGNTGTLKSLQPTHCPLSKPRKKRCTTHHHIARNIYLHQQFLDTSKSRPAPSGSASVYDTTPCDLSLMLTANVNSMHEEGNAPVCSEKDESLRFSTSSTDNVHRKRLVFQQSPQPALHDPAFFFPIRQNRAAGEATAATQSGVSKSTTSINNAPSSNNSASRSLPTSTPVSATSFSHPRKLAKEAPDSVHPKPAFTGTSSNQAMPFSNGSFYSTQTFHPSPPLVLPASARSSSSSSIKKLKTQQAEKQSSKDGFTVSFPSSNGSNISFSSSAQTPAFFHDPPRPQAAKQGHQAAAAGQTAQQKQYQGKSGRESSKVSSGNPSLSSGHTLLFDGPARTLNFMSPPDIGNWPPSSITSTAVVTQQPAPTVTKFQNNAVIFSQTPNQNNALAQWKTSSDPSKLLPRSSSQICFAGATSDSESPPRDGNGNQNWRNGNAATRKTQKSSPVCGSNMSSILTRARSHQLPELKH